MGWRNIPEYSYEKSWWDEPHYGLQMLTTAIVSVLFFSWLFGIIK